MIFNRVGYKEKARMQLSGNWGAAFLVTLMAQCLTFLGYWSTTLNNSPEFSLLVFIFTGPLDVAAACFFIKIALNRPASVNDFFSGLTYFVKAFLVTALAGVLVAIGFVLFIVPGVILSCMFALTSFIVAQNPQIGVIDAIKLSHRLTNGHKFDIFITYLTFLGWLLLGALTLGLADLYVFPYVRTTFANMYFELRDDLLAHGEATYEEFGMPAPAVEDAAYFTAIEQDIACIKDEDLLQAEYEDEFMEEEGLTETPFAKKVQDDSDHLAVEEEGGDEFRG